MEYTYIILQQVLIMFVLMGIGFFCIKLKIISVESNRDLTRLVLNIIVPAVMINAFQKQYDAALIQNILFSVLLSIIIHIFVIIITKIAIRKQENPNLGIERLCVIYTNCGFMALPLINALFHDEGVMYATMNIIIFNIFIFSHGVSLLEKKTHIKQTLRSIISPTIVCIVFSFILFIGQIQLPAILGKPIEYIANMNTPLAMIVAGAYIAQADLRAALANKRIYYITFLRLLLIPCCILLLFMFFPQIDKIIKLTLLVSFTCPTATTTLMFAEKYEANPLYCSQIITITTLFCTLFIPLYLFLGDLIL